VGRIFVRTDAGRLKIFRGVTTTARNYRQIRAIFNEHVITVYQAYAPEIAALAFAAGKFVPPFKRERMTWIKPSFLWMMYRSAWATKLGQERILAIDITRDGFEWALAHSALSHFDPGVHKTRDAWKASLALPVRIQWDPEPDIRFQPTFRRAIQIGLGAEAVDLYVGKWTIDIRDVTELAHTIRDRLNSADEDGARLLLPTERPYPLSAEIMHHIGATS
jgi:hypothetical protein